MCYLTHLIVLMILNIKKVVTFAPVKKTDKSLPTS